MVRSLLLLAGLVALSYGLTCKKCSSTIMKMQGFTIGEGPSAEDLKCVTKTCASGEDVCTYGYATIGFKGPFSITGDETNAPEIEMEILMDWFKDCGTKAESDCDHITNMMTMMDTGDDDSKLSVAKCDIKSCETDDCNDKTITEINPDPLKEISCYACKKSTVNGGPNTDPDDPDQPECSETYKKKCPLGTEFCWSGNMEMTVGEQKMDMEYVKDCGSGPFRSCDAFSEMIKQSASFSAEAASMKMTACNIKTCDGDLCNTMTADEVKSYNSGITQVLSCLLASVLVYLWV